MTDIPLLNGETIRTNRAIDVHPDVDETRTIKLHADFAQESLPDWLTYVTDNGPADPIYTGLSSGGATTDVTLRTGTVATGDTTALIGPTIHWSQWQEVRAYAYGFRQDADTNATSQLTLGNSHRPQEAVETFRTIAHNGVSKFMPRVRTGGSDISITDISGESFLDRRTMGFRIYDNGGGHTVTWILDGMSIENWGESEGFPADTPLDLSVGIRSLNTSDSHSLTIDGIYIELIPY